MSVVVVGNPGDICGCCKEPIRSQFGYFDHDLRVVVCPECRYRLSFVHAYLGANGMKSCIQVSGNKPLPE